MWINCPKYGNTMVKNKQNKKMNKELWNKLLLKKEMSSSPALRICYVIFQRPYLHFLWSFINSCFSKYTDLSKNAINQWKWGSSVWPGKYILLGHFTPDFFTNKDEQFKVQILNRYRYSRNLHSFIFHGVVWWWFIKGWPIFKDDTLRHIRGMLVSDIR